MTSQKLTGLRRRYAGLAMQSLINISGDRSEALMELSKDNGHQPHDQIAKMAFEMADAMVRWEEKHYTDLSGYQAMVDKFTEATKGTP